MSQSNYLVHRTKIYLSAILAIAAVLRIIFLSKVPIGFYCDEAFDGYEAYCLLQTLRSSSGEFLPLFLKRFNIDYSEASFKYIIAPFIHVFGLNEFAVRLPAAIIGILTILVVYYIAKECFGKKVGLISALFLAINPWDIHFNRIAFRVNLLVLLFCLGMLFFIKSFRNPKYLPLSAAIFAVSLHTYTAGRVFIPVFLLALAIFFWEHLWSNKKQTLIAIAIFLPIFIFLFTQWTTPEGMVRVRSAGGIHNPLISAYSYLTYFSPKLLFFTGHPDYRFSNRSMGAFHYFELITIPAGLFFLLRENGKYKIILLLWLLLYPVPGFLISHYHANRGFVGAPIFAILSAYGISKILEQFRVSTKVYVSIIAFLAAASIAIFCKNYFVDYPNNSAYDWQYGIRDAIAYAEKSSYKCVVVSNDIGRSCGQSFIFVAFYTKYPPAQYQANQLNKTDANGDRVMGKYRIVKLPKDPAPVMKRSLHEKDKCLLIVDAKKMGEISATGFDLQQVSAIKDPRGVELIKLIEVTKKT